MRFRLSILLCLLFLACGLAWPSLEWPTTSGSAAVACGDTDYSERETCKGCWVRFTDGNLASAAVDHCDTVGQDGADTLTWGVLAEADDGDVPTPTASPTNADSVLLPNQVTANGWNTETGYTHDDLTVGMWVKRLGGAANRIALRRGDGTTTNGDWDISCPNTGVFQTDMSGTLSGSPGPECPSGAWSFIAMRYDGETGSDEIQAYASTGQGTNTLLDCDGLGGSTCGTDAVGPHDGAEGLTFSANVNDAQRWNGNIYEVWLCEEALTAEQICEICRCSFYGDNQTDRDAACNSCDMGSGTGGASPSPWPRLKWPGT
jgi:hypothetical protein